jgi:hypothetical protein
VSVFISKPGFSRTDLLDRKIHWLVELDTGSERRMMLSRDALQIPSAEHGTFQVYPGLGAVKYTDEVDFFGIGKTTLSFKIKALFPVDIVDLISKGLNLTTVRCSISRWAEGTDYSDRVVMISDTRITDPSYGDKNEVVSFGVRTTYTDDVTIIPARDAMLSEFTWSGTGPKSTGSEVGKKTYGQPYPVVIGQPGYSDPNHHSFASRAILQHKGFDYPIIVLPNWIVAGHEVTPGSTVTIMNTETRHKTDPLPVQYGVDDLGQTYAYAAIALAASAAGTMVADDINFDTEYLVKWNTGGGVPNQARTAPMRGGGDLLEWFMNQADDLVIDRGRLNAAKRILNQFRFDFCLDETAEIWSVVKNHLLKYLPATLAVSGEGIYPIAWNRELRNTDAVASIDVDRDQFERTSMVDLEFLGREPMNNFSMSYAKRWASGNWAKLARMSGDFLGDANTQTNENETESLYCKQSRTRYGEKDKETEAASIYDPSTAYQVLSFWSRIYALPAFSVEYVAPHEWGWLRAGSVIEFTDTSIGFTAQSAVVQAIEWSDDGLIGIRLTWIEDLPRDSRSFGT